MPVAPIALYAVSKTALLGLTRALAEELGPEGIRVNCIAPGARPWRRTECGRRSAVPFTRPVWPPLMRHPGAGTVPTKFAQALVEDPAAEEASKARTFLGRLGTPQDIAAGVAYLVSPRRRIRDGGDADGHGRHAGQALAPVRPLDWL